MADDGAKPKIGSLKDRIKQFEASSSASSSGPTPPPLRPKPATLGQWKPKPLDPPSPNKQTSFEIADNSTHAKEDDSQGTGMSATDAMESISKGGGTLKERMAALQGKGAFGNPAAASTAPPLPSNEGKPRVWRASPAPPLQPKPVVEITPTDTPVDESHEATELTNPEVSVSSPADNDPRKPNDATQHEEGQPGTEEDEEREKRAAIAARMARLGGAKLGMPIGFGVPTKGLSKPTTPATPTNPAAAESEDGDATESTSSRPRQTTLNTALQIPLPKSQGSLLSPGDDLPSESDASTSSKLVPPRSPAIPRSPDSMPIPALPKRTAGPRRKKSVKEIVPPAIEDTPPVPSTDVTPEGEPEAKSLSEVTQNDTEARISESSAAGHLSEELPSVAPSEVATPPPASPSVLTTEGEEESEDVASSPLVRPKVDIPTDPSDDLDTNLLTPRAGYGSTDEAEVAYPTETGIEDEQGSEGDEDIRKQRVAEKMAKLGAVNPLAPGSVSPTSPHGIKDEETSGHSEKGNKFEQSHVESIIPADESENKVAVLSSSGQITGGADSSHRPERFSNADVAIVTSEVDEEDYDVDYPMMSPVGGGSSAYGGFSEPAASPSEPLPRQKAEDLFTEGHSQVQRHTTRPIPPPPMHAEPSINAEQEDISGALTAALARRPPIPPSAEEEISSPSRSLSRTPSPSPALFVREGAPSPPSIGERSQLYSEEEYEVEEQEVEEPEVESESPPPEELEEHQEEQEEPPKVENVPPPLPAGRPQVPNVRRSIPPPPPPPPAAIESPPVDVDHTSDHTANNVPPPLPGGRPPVPNVRRSIPPPPRSMSPRYTEPVTTADNGDHEDTPSTISNVPPPLPSGRPPIPVTRRSIPPPPRSASPRSIEITIPVEMHERETVQPAVGMPPPLPAGKPSVPFKRKSIPPPPPAAAVTREEDVEAPSTSPPASSSARSQRPQQSLMMIPNSPTGESETEEVDYMIGESPVAQVQDETHNIRKAAERPAMVPPRAKSPIQSKRKEIMDDEEGDPVDPHFIGRHQSPPVSQQPTPTPPRRVSIPQSPPHKVSTPQRQTSEDGQPPAAEEAEDDGEAARRRTIAERMAKLGGIKFGMPVPAPRAAPVRKMSEHEKEEASNDKQEEDQADQNPEEAQRARRAALAARMAAMGGRGFGMYGGVPPAPAPPVATRSPSPPPQREPETSPSPPPLPTSRPPVKPKADLSEAVTRTPPPMPKASGPVPGETSESELEMVNAETEDEGEIVEQEDEEPELVETPPAPPSRSNRPPVHAINRSPPPIPGKPRSMSIEAQDVTPPAVVRRAPSTRQPPAPVPLGVEYVVVDEENPQNRSRAPQTRTIPEPPRDASNGPSMESSGQWELPNIPSGSLDLGRFGQGTSKPGLQPPKHLETDASWTKVEQEQLSVPSTSQMGPITPSEPFNGPAPPKVSVDTLAALSEKYGAKIVQSAQQIHERSKRLVIGDGSSTSFLYMALAPTGASTTSLGHLIYAQTGGSVQKRLGDIMPGDIVALYEAHFKGHKGGLGLGNYSAVWGSREEPVLGIVSDFEAKKSKIKAYAVNQHPNSYPTIDAPSYKLDDLKSGTVKVFRVAEEMR